MNLMTLAGRAAPRAIARLPGTPGVYRFRDARGRVLYIGRATALRSRVASYWSDLRDRAHLAPMVSRVARIEAVSCASPHEAAWLERNLLEQSMPPWNRTAGGQESVVFIRMDEGPAAPGLSVQYRTPAAGHVRYFGPYLGGLRVRQAVTALHRILPLGYAGTGLRGAQQDMARARGVTGADRDELIRAVTAVLQREPVAVAQARDNLVLVRDRAAGSLAFEFAAQVQDEIQALDWVTSPQRVTTAGGRGRRRVRMVRRCAGQVRGPRRAAVRVVPAPVLAPARRAAAGRHPRGLGRVRPQQRRARRRAGLATAPGRALRRSGPRARLATGARPGWSRRPGRLGL